MKPICVAHLALSVVLCFKIVEVVTYCTCYYNPTLSLLNLSCTPVNDTEIERCFRTYRTAKSLIFQNSGLESVPDSIIILKHLTYLDLTNNGLTHINFSNVDTVCNNIKELHLELNDINSIYEGDLDCFISLESIYLSNNSLSRIQTRAFNAKLANLTYIHLVHNNLLYLDISMAMLPPRMPYKGLLNASWNDISHVSNDLDFTINQINVNMSFGAYMIHNNFTRINLTHYMELFHVTDPLHQLYRLWNCGFDVRFNPLICDCEMYPLAVKLSLFRPMDPDNPVFAITCAHPAPLAGMLVYKVKDNDFNCSVSPQCPDNCACKETIACGLLTVTCGESYSLTELPDVVPSSKQLQISVHSPWLSRLSPRQYLHNASRLDVSQSSVSTVETSVIQQFDDMTSIYLHENSIQILPKQIEHIQFGKLQVLTIHGNPFVCDCNTLWLKKWILQNQANIPFQDKILCGSGKGKGRALVDVPDSEYTCDDDDIINNTLQLVGVISISFLATVVVASFISSRPWFKVFVTEYISPSWCRKKRQMNQEFDVFPSHSSRDDSFVHGELVTRLHTHKPPYKVFIDEQQFIGGKSVAYNINRAIELSHTTLLILSNEFLRSKWCMMEFRQAHLKLLHDMRVNLVIIVIEELDKTLIDEELQEYMHTHVYIKRTEKFFWSKLLQALPIRINQTVGESNTDRNDCTTDSTSESSPLIQ